MTFFLPYELPVTLWKRKPVLQKVSKLNSVSFASFLGLLCVLYALILVVGSLTQWGTLFHLFICLRKNMGGYTLSSTRELTARSVSHVGA